MLHRRYCSLVYVIRRHVPTSYSWWVDLNEYSRYILVPNNKCYFWILHLDGLKLLFFGWQFRLDLICINSCDGIDSLDKKKTITDSSWNIWCVIWKCSFGLSQTAKDQIIMLTRTVWQWSFLYVDMFYSIHLFCTWTVTALVELLGQTNSRSSLSEYAPNMCFRMSRLNGWLKSDSFIVVV